MMTSHFGVMGKGHFAFKAGDTFENVCLAEFDNMQHGNSTRGRRCGIETLNMVKFLYPHQQPRAN